MIEIRILAIWWMKYLCALESHSLLCTVGLIIRILTVIITPCSLDIGAYLPYGPILHHMHEISQLRILKWWPICEPTPKRDPRITNFSIPDPEIENSIPGLQSLVKSTVLLSFSSLMLIVWWQFGHPVFKSLPQQSPGIYFRIDLTLS